MATFDINLISTFPDTNVTVTTKEPYKIVTILQNTPAWPERPPPDKPKLTDWG